MLFFNINNESKILNISAGKAEVKDYDHIWRKLDECQLFFVIEGDLYIQEENEYFHLQKGDYLITQKNVNYGGYKPSTAKFHWMHFSYEKNEVLFSNEKNENYDYSFLRKGHIIDTDAFVVLLVLLEQYSADSTKRIISSKLNLLVLLELATNVTKPHVIMSKDKRFQPIMAYFKQNPFYNEISDIKSMATFFGYSEKYLIKLFKKNTGKSPLQFLIDKKMLRAEEMLSDTTLSVKQIAEKLNYDYYYFMRLFKKRTGMSPTEFRKFVIPNWKSYL